MSIDAHTHLGFNEIINSRADELVSSMKKAGVDKAIVLAGELNALSTERLLQEILPYKDKLFPLGSISPLSSSRPSIQKVEEWLSKKTHLRNEILPRLRIFLPG